MPMILLLTMMLMTLFELLCFYDGCLVRVALVVAHDVAELLLADVLQSSSYSFEITLAQDLVACLICRVCLLHGDEGV